MDGRGHAVQVFAFCLSLRGVVYCTSRELKVDKIGRNESLPSPNLFNFEPGRVEVVPGVHAWVMSEGPVDVVLGVQMFYSCIFGDYII